jgi:hypothetical protein
MTFKEHLAKSLQNPEFRKEWEAHEDCRKQESRLTRWIIRHRKERDRARHLVGQIQVWLDLESNISPLVKQRLQERIREQVNWTEEERGQ